MKKKPKKSVTKQNNLAGGQMERPSSDAHGLASHLFQQPWAKRLRCSLCAHACSCLVCETKKETKRARVCTCLPLSRVSRARHAETNKKKLGGGGGGGGRRELLEERRRKRRRMSRE